MLLKLGVELDWPAERDLDESFLDRATSEQREVSLFRPAVALQVLKALLEEEKADTFGLWLRSFQKKNGWVDEKQGMVRYTSALMHILGLLQYPLSGVYPRMVAIQLGWYLDAGAVTWDEKTGRFVESNTLNGKKFRAYSDVGPQWETQRQETTDIALKMIETLAPIPGAQELIPELVGVAVENMAGTGLESIKKKNRQIRLLAGTVDPENDEEKALLQQAQQKQDQQDPLKEAVTQQQLSEARNLDASSAEKISSAELKSAQTRKTLSDIQVDQEKTASDIRVNEAKTLAEIRKEILQPLADIPI